MDGINWVKSTLADLVDNLIDSQKKKRQELTSSEEDFKGTKLDIYI